MSATVPTSSAVRALAMEYKSMEEEPVEGFRVKLVNDESLFEWEVAIFGPPDTLYQGGYFKVSRETLVYHPLCLNNRGRPQRRMAATSSRVHNVLCTVAVAT